MHRPPDRPLRVTVCPVNTAGVPWTNVQALRARGVDARLVVFNRYRLHPEADVSLDLPQGQLRRQLAQWRALARLLPRTDVFHFVFGLTLVPQSVQFPLLRALRKKSVLHYLGSDIRGRSPDELAYGRKADAQIVGSYDAIRWVPEAEVIPPGVDLARIEPAPPSDRPRPLIVHAPSSRRRKGTDAVIAACEGLDADLELVEGLHHEEAFERYRAADIVVDQLNAGWYGLFAIEAMALGKPVVATDYSANVDFMNAGNGFPVRYRLVPIERDHGPYRAGWLWAEPDEEHAAEQMRRVFADPAAARRVGERARADVREQLSHEAVGRRIRRLLERVVERVNDAGSAGG